MMNTATTILFSTLILTVASQICDKVGLCQVSKIITFFTNFDNKYVKYNKFLGTTFEL